MTVQLLPVMVCPGELRPDLLQIVGVPNSRLQCLLSAPGTLASYDGSSALVEEPTKPLTKKDAFGHRAALLRDFARWVDALPQTEIWESSLHAWILGIQRGLVQVRHADSRPIHSRMFSRHQSTAVIQGPITLANWAQNNELVVELVGSQHEKARAWFSSNFDQATEVSEEVRASLEGSWAGQLTSPRDIYYKVLAEYFREVVDGDGDSEDNPMLEFLTEFQRDAYQCAKSILRRYGGVFLADVVGLGKTFIALALLNHLQRVLGEHAVVVAPPAVIPTWKELAAEFRVEIAPVSHGQLELLDSYSDREILVIDESHNFRNDDTRRYELIEKWLRPNGAPSTRKVILLSATPQNNSSEDVRAQLQLFPDNFDRLPYRGESLETWFKAVAQKKASLVEMLRHVVVRRTRGFVALAHPGAKLRRRLASGQYVEEPLVFPTRISGEDQTLRYNIEATFGSVFYPKLLAGIGSLRCPLHGVGKYALDDAATRKNSIIVRLKRGAPSLRGLFKVLLLKRLESSIHSLAISLRNLLERLTEGARRLDRGLVDVPGAQLVYDDEEAPPATTELSSRLFDVNELAADIDFDRRVVRDLVRIVEDQTALPDPKLARLVQYLRTRAPDKHRTIVFTQFADTANYLASCLSSTFEGTEVATGSTPGLTKIVQRFAPRANRVATPPTKPINLLIATDALSEGVNLQDADTLVNFDIHWNPVRLIQRAGRIDRIGSEHQSIHIASFLPERELEANLGLEAVLRSRIEEFVAVFGEDSHVLPASEPFTPEGALAAYTGAALLEQNDDLDG